MLRDKIWRGILIAVQLVFLVMQGDLVAADPVKWAADGSLWEKAAAEAVRALFDGQKCSRVDERHIRILRSTTLTMGKLPLGDITLEITEGGRRFASLSTTLYNKGDDGEIEKQAFEHRLKESVELLNAYMGAEGEEHRQGRKETGVRTRAWAWQNDDCAALLEAASTGKGKKYVAEFIRLSMAPTVDALERGGARNAAKKADLKVNVERESNGDVWIKNIPMVDQGEKGYCVPATVSRVFAYYGMDGVDQHALAALCKSSQNGTTADDMAKALKSICIPFHMTVKALEWVGIQDVIKRLQKKVNRSGEMPDDREVVMMMLEDIGKHPGSMNKGLNEIKRQIDAGIPVVWAVVLGIFPEQNIPQTVGGHMRLIIGYNEKNNTIIYSDSWGIRHAKKSMPMKQACAMSFRLWVLRPTL